jgi:hypothetical protein
LLYDPEVEPLWTEAERLDIAVGVHGMSTALSQEGFTRIYGWPFSKPTAAGCPSGCIAWTISGRSTVRAFPDATNEFLALTTLSQETKRKVLWNNCARYYNLN